jgi:hypothetical protein
LKRSPPFTCETIRENPPLTRGRDRIGKGTSFELLFRPPPVYLAANNQARGFRS